MYYGGRKKCICTFGANRFREIVSVRADLENERGEWLILRGTAKHDS